VIYIYSDGSCGRDSVGSWVATIHREAQVQKLFGVLYPACITRCELIPIIESLRWLHNVEYKDHEHKLDVQIVTDAELNAKRLMNVGNPSYKNRDLWGDIDALREYFNIDAIWRKRNTTPQLHFCDQWAGELRKNTSNFMLATRPKLIKIEHHNKEML